VIEDTSFSMLNYGPPAPSLWSLDQRVIQVGTFSTVLAPGLRLGYLRLSNGLRRRMIERIQYEDAAGPLFLQVAFAGFVKRGRFRAHLQRVLPKYLARRDTLLSALRSSIRDLATWEIPMAGLSVGVTLNRPVDQTALFEACLGRGFAFSQGRNFVHPDDADRFLRLSFGNQPQESIQHAIETFGALLRTAR